MRTAKRVYNSPSLDDIQEVLQGPGGHAVGRKSSVFENPHRYYVDLSQKLWDTRSTLLKKLSK